MFPFGGRALNMEWRRIDVLTVIKLRMPEDKSMGVSVRGDNVRTREKKNSDHQLRSQNTC